MQATRINNFNMNIKRHYSDNSDEEKSTLDSVSIGRMNDESLSETPEEIENGLIPDKIVNRLTALVRKQYHTYLEKLLKENYQAWCQQELGFVEEPADDWIKTCASLYEEKAVKSCMIVQFYRKSMLKIIANIRRETVYGKLAHKLKEFKEDNENTVYKTEPDRTADASTQTLEEERKGPKSLIENHKEDFSLSLEEKIEFFQKRLAEVHMKQQVDKRLKERIPQKRKISNSSDRERKHKRHQLPIEELNSPICSPQFTDSPLEVQNVPALQPDEEDEVAKELEVLFGGVKDDIDDIFGEGNCDPQVDQILKEIERSKLPGETKINIKFPNDSLYKGELKIVDKKFPPTDTVSVLCESIWPCELHMRMQRLREVLSSVADRGIRCHDRIKYQFNELFGEDSDDEFAVYSPTLELNEVLLASCKKRIAPWVVKHLMKPMKEGLIGNRFLFKKLAKRLATSIVDKNQYPDEDWIKRTVEEYFCFRQRILSIEDIMP